jgi:glutathione S-transferase
MFLLEKGLTIPTQVMVLGTGDTQTPAYLARNPLGQVPLLETDEGGCLSETLAICEYIEELHPQPVLIGSTPFERGETRMWTRRVDLNICQPILQGFRYSPAGAGRYRVLPARETAETMKRVAQDNLAWLDGQMRERSFLCGDRFSLADIVLFTFVQHGIEVGQLLKPEWSALGEWFARVGARPSASASAQSQVELSAISGTV